jgi:predicted dienelactone hydrolase
MIQILLALLVVLSQPLSAMHRPSNSYSLGVQTIEYLDASRQRPLVVELWYPTGMRGPVENSKDPIWIHPEEVRDAPFFKSKSKYPLILMSHGHKGGRREMSWLAEALVKAGYVVASVDHYGDLRFHFDPFAAVCFWNRPLDFTFLLDQFEKEDGLKAYIDFDRIGFIGYSLGGMTGLALAGGQAQNILEVLAKFKAYYPMDEQMLGRIDFSAAKKTYKEPRIKSMLLLCPAVFLYPPESLKQIKIPLGLIAALGDEILPFQEHAYQIVQNMIPSKLKMLREGISHSAPLNRLTEAGKLLIYKGLHKDPPESLHGEVSRFAAEFFHANFQ